MPSLDVRTVFFTYVLSIALGVVAMALLWLQNRRRFPETASWLTSDAMQLVAILLIALRGGIPDILSILVANVLVVAGSVVLLDGLMRFVGQRRRQIHNYVLLGAFTLVHAHFTLVHPSLAARNINVAAAVGCMSAQAFWLVLWRADPKLREATKATGWVLLGFFFVHATQILNNLVRPQGNDLFHSDAWEALFLLANQVLFLALTFTLSLSVSRRLRADLELQLAERQLAESHLRESEERFSKAFQTSPHAVTITRMSDGMFIEVNESFIAMTGYSREELLAESSFSLRMWAREEQRDEAVSALSRGEAVANREYLLRTRSGDILTARFSAQTIQLEQGGLCLLSIIEDVTVYKLVDQELRDNRRFLAELIEHSGALICTKGWDGRYELVNRRWEEITGVPRVEALGRTDLELFPAEIAQQFRVHDLEVLQTGSTVEREEHLQTTAGEHWLLAVKFPLRNDEGNITAICGVLSDITQRKRAEERIRHLANHDHLTNLPSMRLARDRLEMSIHHARREKRAACVMFIDLDGFKSVNDSCGHDAGDALLKELAQRMSSRLRHTDTVARIGGDEFLLIAGGLHGIDDARFIANKVLEDLRRPFMLDGVEVSVSASIGIALFPNHGEAVDQLIKEADGAMYRVKKSRKNGICVVNEPEQAEP